MSLSFADIKEIGISDWGADFAPPARVAQAAPKAAASKAAPKSASPAADADAVPAAPVKELTKEELAGLSKQERTAYYAALRAGPASAQPKKAALSKKERADLQEQQRKAKEDLKLKAVDNSEMLEELKLQGLSEEQAREVLKELAVNVEAEDDDDPDESAPEDLLSSVKRWMAEHREDKANAEMLRDFNLNVRFQGHVDSTPPDHLKCMLQVMVTEACATLDLLATKLPPKTVQTGVDPIIERWTYMIDQLYGKTDVLVAIDVIVQTVHQSVMAACTDASEASKDCAVVGILMSIREQVESVEDEELLTGCKRLEPRSRVMEGFIGHLEESLDDDEDGEDEEDDDD